MQNLIDIMTINENDIFKYSFDELWNKMWLYPTTYSDDIKSKFDKI